MHGAEVHRNEHKFTQTQIHHRAEQASFNLQRSLSEYEGEQQAKDLAEALADVRLEATTSTETVLSVKVFVKELGRSKLKSDCPISQRVCLDHGDTVWWQMVVGNLPDAVRDWVELQGFSECDGLKEAATAQ